MFNKPRHIKLGLWVVLLGLMLLSACSTLGKSYPVHYGRVLHEINDTPIGQTIVVALWKGTQQTGDTDKLVCYHVETTQSDDTGHFSIPSWSEPGRYSNLKDKQIYVEAFHKDYQTSELTSEELTDKNYIYYLRKPLEEENADKARRARQQYLLEVVANASCDLDGDSRMNLQPLFREIVAEAQQLVVTDQDRMVVQKLNAWLSYVTPHQDYNE